MTKLSVDEIEANSTDSNLKIIAKTASGACEIKGATNDAILQLNCSDNSHGVKLKAPASSSGQNYTMILPDNQIAANKLLKVKSITGSGADAVGQLEYADSPAPDLSSLNASNITSGTIPSARFGSITAVNGGGFQLITKTTLTTAANVITFTGLDDNSIYKVIGKKLVFNSNTYASVYWLNQDGSSISDIKYVRVYGTSNFNSENQKNTFIIFGNTDNHSQQQSLIADFMTQANNTWMFLKAYSGQNNQNRTEIWATIDDGNSSDRIGQFRLNCSSQFQSGTEVLLYKYIEA